MYDLAVFFVNEKFCYDCELAIMKQTGVRIFAQKPSADEMSNPQLQDGVATSNVSFLNNDKGFEIRPQPIPIQGAVIWMALVVAIIFAVEFWRQETVLIVMGGAAVFLIIPFMVLVFCMLNAATGDQPYLVFQSKPKQLFFPRLDNRKCHLSQVESIHGFQFGNDHAFVSFLVKDSEHQWYQLHVMNDLANNFMIARRLAVELNVPFRLTRYTTKESRERGIL